MKQNFFDSPAKFAEHLVKLIPIHEMALNTGLKTALGIIKKKAKAKLGHYQEESGPFNAWQELHDITKKDRVEKNYPENEPLLRSGDLRDSYQDEDRGLEGIVGSKLSYAGIQEHGGYVVIKGEERFVPPRPSIGPAAYESKEEIKAIIGAASFSGIMGKVVPHGNANIHVEEEYEFKTD